MHLDDSHLYKNLAGYFVALLPPWLVFKSYHRERMFYMTLLLFFVAFPIVLSIASYGIYQFGIGADEAATRGFSGIVCAIFGLLSAAILGLVRARAGWLAAFSGGASIAIIVMVQMLLQNATLGVELLVLGFIGVLTGLMGVVYGGRTTNRSQLLTAIQENGLDIALVALGVSVLLTFLPSLLPLDFVHEYKVTDIFTHALGLFLGFITGMVLASWRTQVFSARSN